MATIDYSSQAFGGIGYRLDIRDGDIHHAYTTNADGSGLFFHNGRGDRMQVRGDGQFSARSLADFRRKTTKIADGYR